MGFDVVTSFSVTEALAFVTDASSDVLITDLHMSTRAGLQVPNVPKPACRFYRASVVTLRFSRFSL
jgi:CheY-like chemotaxis protein